MVDASDDAKIRKVIPAKVVILHSSRKKQDEATESQGLGAKKRPESEPPSPPVSAGDRKVGGHLTNAYLTAISTVATAPPSPSPSLSNYDLLLRIQQGLSLGNDSQSSSRQVPQLSSSRRIRATQSADVAAAVVAAPKKYKTKRALLIGINYSPNDKLYLSHCHATVERMKAFLLSTQQHPQGGMTESQIQLLVDLPKDTTATNSSTRHHLLPTKKNILLAMRQLVKEPCDYALVVICARGGRRRRANGNSKNDDGDNGAREEEQEETLIPCDYATAGTISQAELHSNLIRAMPAQTALFCLVDIIGSGSLVQLPYVYSMEQQEGGDEHRDFVANAAFDLSAIVGLAVFGTAAAGGVSDTDCCCNVGGCPGCELDSEDCCAIQ